MFLTFNSGDIGRLASLSAVRKEQRRVGERLITYTVFEAVSESGLYYALSAAEEGYGVLCGAGNDRSVAEGVFELICDGEVAPCTLRDVLEDICSAAAE